MPPRSRESIVVGVAEHGNSAELVTIARGGKLLDRRRIDLTGPELPTHPYHHEGSWAVGRYANTPWARPISLPDAIALVERVHAAADHGAREALEKLAADLVVPITGITLRECPEQPSTIEERITDNRAQTFADSVMYRQALANAASARGWTVTWYDRETVLQRAAEALATKNIDTFLQKIGKELGPPWQARHKLAAAAAIAASTL